MYLFLIHRNLSEYESRLAVVERLKTIVTLEHHVVWLAGPSRRADCIIVHSSQDQDIADARSFIEQKAAGTRLIVFGGAAAEKPIGDYGYEVPAEKFETQACEFFNEWKRLGGFPGWEYLTSNPEYDTCLAILNCLVIAARGGKAEECSEEWGRLRQALDAFAREDLVLQGQWIEAEAAEAALRKADSNAREVFASLRRLLIGDGRMEPGIGQRLASARRSAEV